MKTTITTPLKPFALAITVALAFNAGHVFAEETMDTYNNSNWQSPLVVEFYALDTTGNGLLLPNEASKGKAFNKKTFAQADADHDGYIDQNEYIYFKTGAWPDATKNSANASSNSSSMPSSAQTMTTAEGDEMAVADMTNTEATAEKRTVGKVIDDSIITAKVKAEILKAPQLKSLQISVETRNGEVLLSGFVDTASARLQAEEIVARIEGVKTVINSLEVKV
ncbi:MAG: BON domain-containing protein [Pseudomonadota bacterium]